jgi:hypothetical protein
MKKWFQSKITFQFGVMSVGYSFQANSHFVEITNGAVIFRYINNCYFLICKQKFWFQKRKHSQLSLKRSRVHTEMNYEKFKRSDRPDHFRRFSLCCWGKVFQWLPKDRHKKVSDFCKMKFVHVHFAADWMNKFPNCGRYQIANIISWQNSLHNFPLRPWKLTILIIKSWRNKKTCFFSN